MSTSHDPSYDNRDPLFNDKFYSESDPKMALAKFLDDLEVAGDEFARTFIQDDNVRKAYKAKIREYSDLIFEAASNKEITALDGAKEAWAKRNRLLLLAREQSSVLGRAKAEFLKKEGLQFNDLAEKKARDLFNRSIHQLSAAEQEKVHLEIIRSAGRSRPSVDSKAARFGVLGKLIWAFSLFQATKNIVKSKNKKDALTHEVSTLLSGLAGGVGGAMAVRAIWSTAGPIGIGAGMLLGSMFSAEAVHEFIKDHFNHRDDYA